MSSRPRRDLHDLPPPLAACRWVVLFGLALGSGATAAQNDEGHFEIRSANVQLVDDVYYLNAWIDYSLSPGAFEALESGVPLTFELQIELIRSRLLFDAKVARLLQRYQLQHNALTNRYLVKNLNSGEQDSYSSLGEALQDMGRIFGIPILDETLIETDRGYELRMRAVLDVRDFPAPLRFLAFWIDDWRLASDWYRWPLRP